MTDNLTIEDRCLIVALSPSNSLDMSPKKNWVENAGGLPSYIVKIAKGLIKSGKSVSTAISIAISRCKVWASGGGGVKPDTRAKAAAAIAEWEKLKAKSHAKSTTKSASKIAATAYNGDYDFLCLTSYSVDGVKDAWNEEERHRQQAFQATQKIQSYQTAVAPRDYPDWYYRYIKEVWSDFLIIQGDDRDDLSRVPYTVADDGTITFGEEVPIEMSYKDVTTPDAVVETYGEDDNEKPSTAVAAFSHRLLAEIDTLV